MKTFKADKVTIRMRNEDGELVDIEAGPAMFELAEKGLIEATDVHVDGKPIAIEIKCVATSAGERAAATAWREYIESLKNLIAGRILQRVEACGVCSFEEAAAVLADVLNEEIDAGFEFSDEQLERIAEVLEDCEE